MRYVIYINLSRGGNMIRKDGILILEEYLKKICDKGVFPGASYGLMSEKDLYTNFLGKSQLVPEEKVLEEDAIYDLASLTKVIATTTSILILMERGYLTLDTRVSSVLTKYKNKNVTIKHLLIHMSGHDADIDCKEMNKDDLIEAVYDNIVSPSRFEKEVVYSDIGFIILGFIIDKITGSFEEFAKENIFKPLNMKDTFFNPGEEYKDRLVATEYCKMRDQMIKGIVHDEKAYLLGGVAGHAGLFSTVEDISNFVIMYLNNGAFNGKQILNKKSIDLVAKSYTPGTNTSRGLGWWIKGENTVLCDFAGDRTLYHSGFTGTSIIMDLDNKIGAVLLTNRVHPTRENNALVDLRRNIHNICFSAISS